MRKDNDEVLRKALDFCSVCKRGHERPKMTWRRQVEEQIGLKTKDAISRAK